MIVSVSLINAETALNGIGVTSLDNRSVCEVLKRITTLGNTDL